MGGSKNGIIVASKYRKMSTLVHRLKYPILKINWFAKKKKNFKKIKVKRVIYWYTQIQKLKWAQFHVHVLQLFFFFFFKPPFLFSLTSPLSTPLSNFQLPTNFTTPHLLNFWLFFFFFLSLSHISLIPIL